MHVAPNERVGAREAQPQVRMHRHECVCVVVVQIVQRAVKEIDEERGAVVQDGGSLPLHHRNGEDGVQPGRLLVGLHHARGHLLRREARHGQQQRQRRAQPSDDHAEQRVDGLADGGGAVLLVGRVEEGGQHRQQRPPCLHVFAQEQRHAEEAADEREDGVGAPRSRERRQRQRERQPNRAARHSDPPSLKRIAKRRLGRGDGQHVDPDQMVQGGRRPRVEHNDHRERCRQPDAHAPLDPRLRAADARHEHAHERGLLHHAR
eukprot:6198282-Pleurochrysis_carterae.AAC.3